MEALVQGNYEKAVAKVVSMGDGDLKIVWESMNTHKYEASEQYDEGVSMDDWAELISSEMDKRQLEKNI
jgi:hypothetical protein